MSNDIQAGTQYLQLADGTTFATNSASAAIQEAMAQAQAQAAGMQGDGTEQGNVLMGGATEITMEGATSEQAALVLQQLAAENAQVILHPSGQEGLSTMQATLQNENGETSMVGSTWPPSRTVPSTPSPRRRPINWPSRPPPTGEP
eukprot:XP_011684047.1 PREDICTED: uncharacterized protein LOC100891035 [Strongylocentrotus purpuratus]